MPDSRDENWRTAGTGHVVRPGMRPNPVGMDLPAPPAWYADAVCAQVDSEIFFPAKGGSVREAKRSGCVVAARCGNCVWSGR